MQCERPGAQSQRHLLLVENDGKNHITVVGSPTISDVEAIMIGIRNPKKTAQSTNDDGQPKSAEIWVDELRLTDFNKSGGWAATARIAADLADLGRIQLTGSYMSDGFGSIEDKQTQRTLEATAGFGLTTDLELGKFLPEKSGIPYTFAFRLFTSRELSKIRSTQSRCPFQRCS